MSTVHRAEDDTPAPIEIATELDPAQTPTTPGNWWRYGLVALFVIAAVLLALQLLGGNRQTAVYPGSPVTAPQTETPPASPGNA
jgi:hypothetical protein